MKISQSKHTEQINLQGINLISEEEQVEVNNEESESQNLTTEVVKEEQQEVDVTEELKQADPILEQLEDTLSLDMADKFFTGVVEVEKVLAYYMIFEQQINSQNIYIVLKGFNRVFVVGQIKQEETIALLEKDPRFDNFFKLLISLVNEVKPSTLVECLKLFNHLKQIDKEKKITQLSTIIPLVKGSIDKLIIEQVQDNEQLLLDSVQMTEIFFQYVKLNFNLFNIFQLVSNTLKQAERTKSIQFTMYSLMIVIKACRYAQAQSLTKFSDLAYRAQQAFLQSLQKPTSLSLLIDLFQNLAQLQLHIHTTNKKIPLLLSHLIDVFLKTLASSPNSLNVYQAIKICESYQKLPATIDTSLYLKCKKYIMDYVKENEQHLNFKQLIMVLHSLCGARGSLYLTAAEEKTLTTHIFDQVQKLQPLSDHHMLMLLKTLNLTLKSWESEINKQILKIYFQNPIQNPLTSVEIGLQLIQLGLYQIGQLKLTEGFQAQTHQNPIFSMIRTLKGLQNMKQKEIDIGFQGKEIEQVIQNKLQEIKEFNLLYIVLTKILKDIPLKDNAFLLTYVYSSLEEYWSQFNVSMKSVLLINCHEADIINGNQGLFNKYSLFLQHIIRIIEQINLEQFESLSQKINFSMQGSYTINFFYSQLAKLLRLQLDSSDDNGSSVLFGIYLKAITSGMVNSLLNLNGTINSQIRLCTSLITQLIEKLPPTVIITSIMIQKLARITQKLLLKTDIVPKMIYRYIEQQTQEEIANPIKMFQHLEVGETITEYNSYDQPKLIEFCVQLTQQNLSNIESLPFQSLSWQLSFFKLYLYVYFAPQKYFLQVKPVKDSVMLDLITSKLKEKILQSNPIKQQHLLLDSLFTLIKRDILSISQNRSELNKEVLVLQNAFIFSHLQVNLRGVNGSQMSSRLIQITQIWNILSRQHKFEFRPSYDDLLNLIAKTYQEIPERTKHPSVILEYLRYFKFIQYENKSLKDQIISDLISKIQVLRSAQLVDILQTLQMMKMYHEQLLKQLVLQVKDKIQHMSHIWIMEIFISLMKLGFINQEDEFIFAQLIDSKKQIHSNVFGTKSQGKQQSLSPQFLWSTILYISHLQIPITPSLAQFLQGQILEYEQYVICSDQAFVYPLVSRQVVDIYNYLEMVDQIEIFPQNLKDLVKEVQTRLRSSNKIDKFILKQLTNKQVRNLTTILDQEKIPFTMNKLFGKQTTDIYLEQSKRILILQNTIYVNTDNFHPTGFYLFHKNILELMQKKSPKEIMSIVTINDWKWRQMDKKQQLSMISQV